MALSVPLFTRRLTSNVRPNSSVTSQFKVPRTGGKIPHPKDPNATKGSVRVPNVVGMSQSSASSAISSAQLKVGSVGSVISSKTAGTVTSQSPSAGQSVTPQSSVSFTVAKKSSVSPVKPPKKPPVKKPPTKPPTKTPPVSAPDPEIALLEQLIESLVGAIGGNQLSNEPMGAVQPESLSPYQITPDTTPTTPAQPNCSTSNQIKGGLFS